MAQFDSGRPDMESIQQPVAAEREYNEAWFKRRAIESIKPKGEGAWDFSDSLLLYQPKGAHEYETMQAEGTAYSELVTKPEREYLESIAVEVAAQLPDGFSYIDLGPGTEHKEQYLFDALREEGKEFEYVPVDINEYFLSLADKHAAGQGIATRPVQASFEELAAKLGPVEKPRFVSLGLTFSNYDPAELFELLKPIAGRGGMIFVDAHMRDRTDMQKLRDVYDVDAQGITMSKFELVDMDATKDVEDILTDERIEVWCKAKSPSPALKEKGIKVGDRLLIFRSLRYTKNEFENVLKKSFKKYVVLDTSTPFVGALLWNE